MNDRQRIAIVIGTRPEAVKLAPVALALSRSRWAAPVVITTGQHGNVVRETLSCFGLRPDIELTVRRGNGSVAELTAGLLSGLDSTLRTTPAKVVVVQGDTSSVLAGAMAGFFAAIPVAHVEAGLRSGDLRSPFPEEAHRRMIAEGIASGLARLVGTEEAEIVTAVEKEFAREDTFPGTGAGARPVVSTNPYGDGRAGERCAAACGGLLGIRPHTPLPPVPQRKGASWK